MMVRIQINEIENRKTEEKIKINCFFEIINKTDKPLATLTKNSKEKTQTTKIMNEGEVTGTKSTDIKSIIWEYYEQLSAKKFRKLTCNGEIFRYTQVTKDYTKRKQKT